MFGLFSVKLTNVGGKQWPQIGLYKTNEMTPKPIKRNLKHTFWNPGVKKTHDPPFWTPMQQDVFKAQNLPGPVFITHLGNFLAIAKKISLTLLAFLADVSMNKSPFSSAYPLASSNSTALRFAKSDLFPASAITMSGLEKKKRLLYIKGLWH